jgi:hypothetical protein
VFWWSWSTRRKVLTLLAAIAVAVLLPTALLLNPLAGSKSEQDATPTATEDTTEDAIPEDSGSVADANATDGSPSPTSRFSIGTPLELLSTQSTTAVSEFPETFAAAFEPASLRSMRFPDAGPSDISLYYVFSAYNDPAVVASVIEEAMGASGATALTSPVGDHLEMRVSGSENGKRFNGVLYLFRLPPDESGSEGVVVSGIVKILS